MDEQVRTTERLWSEEVAIAEADSDIERKETAYVFSNGRRFKDGEGPYEQPV